MIRRIESHNRLNGIVFSVVEFIVAAGVISPFAVYYILHARILYALGAMGIILNCLTVVAFGIHQWIDKDEGIGWRRLAQNKEELHRVRHDNPHMLRDTLILTATILAPYALMILVVAQLLARGSMGTSQNH